MIYNPEEAHFVQSEIALAGISSEQEILLQRLENRRITPESEVPKMEFLFRMRKPCFARGELTAVSGKAKSGKTFICSVLMALCFRHQVLGLERIEGQPSPISPQPSTLTPLKVLWYDTEQSEESTQDILKNRILPMAGISESEFPSDCFQIFNVRGESYSERLSMLEAAVPRFRPDLVILDGIRDLVSDINDGVVAQDVVERLMRLASDNRCCMVCVLHQNKSGEDRNLRGWIGTELKNKSFEVYECAKSAERIFTWTQTDTRKYDITDKVQFSVGENGIPYLCTPAQLLEAQYEAQRKATEQMQRQGLAAGKYPDFNPKYVLCKQDHRHILNVRLLFSDAMTPGTVYTEKALKKQIKLLSNIMRDEICDKTLRQAVNEKIIRQSYDGGGHRIYVRPAESAKPSVSESAIQQDLFSQSDDEVPF